MEMTDVRLKQNRRDECRGTMCNYYFFCSLPLHMAESRLKSLLLDRMILHDEQGLRCANTL